MRHRRREVRRLGQRVLLLRGPMCSISLVLFWQHGAIAREAYLVLGAPSEIGIEHEEGCPGCKCEKEAPSQGEKCIKIKATEEETTAFSPR